MNDKIFSDQVYNSNCLFCSISKGTESSERVLEDENFIVIKNKYPTAPVHLLVIDKFHRVKTDVISGKYREEGYYDKLFAVVYQVMVKLNLNLTGYKIVNNGAGYHHFDHEHFHILGGSEKEPHD